MNAHTFLPGQAIPLGSYPFNLDYPFDELPLFPGCGSCAHGMATIVFARDGEWVISAIELDRWSATDPRIDLPITDEFYPAVVTALRRERSDAIDRAVWSELDERRAA